MMRVVLLALLATSVLSETPSDDADADHFDTMVRDADALDDFEYLIGGSHVSSDYAEVRDRNNEEMYKHILQLLQVVQDNQTTLNKEQINSLSMFDKLLSDLKYDNKDSEKKSPVHDIELPDVENYKIYMNYTRNSTYVGVNEVQGVYIDTELYHSILKQVLSNRSRVDDLYSWYLLKNNEEIIQENQIENQNMTYEEIDEDIADDSHRDDNYDFSLRLYNETDGIQNDAPDMSDEDGDYQRDRRKGRRKMNVTTVDYRKESDEDAGDGVTLAIVFDGTGSMWDDLVQVRLGAHLIMEAMLERIDKPIKNYVLVPFHDPKIGPLTLTTDHAKFRIGLQDIVVHGGGDCPEMSIGAVKMALEASLPNSFIYVFTDASAKDYRLLDEVLALVQKKRSQIVFVLTGDCGERGKVGYQVYEKIAATSSGQVFNLNKTNVKEVLNFVRDSLQSRRVNLLSLNQPGASTDELDIVVDNTLSEFTISVSGLNPSINVTDPDGRTVDRAPQLQSLLSLDNARVVNVVDPDPGKWTVTVHSDSEHTVRSSGKSDFDFKHGFSISDTESLEETNHRPLKGAKNTILVQATNMTSVANLTNFQIIDFNTAVVQKSSPLSEVPSKPGLFRGGPFVPSNDFFYLGVEGIGKDGAAVKRITATAIQSQRPEPPQIHLPGKQSSWISGPTVFKCRVESLVPFWAAWHKDGKPISPSKQYKQTSDVLWQLKETSEDSEGNYTCQADNMAGKSAKTTRLTITGPPPDVTTATSASAVPEGSAAMSCEVSSLLKYKLSWAQVTIDVTDPESKREILIPLQDNFRTKILENGTLILRYANPSDEGWYACIAESKGGRSERRVQLSLREPLSVEVSPELFEFQYGTAFTISCKGEGTPMPTLVWKKEGEVIQDDGRRTLVSGEGSLDLRVVFAKNGDEGNYICVAESDVEKGEASTRGVYVETPSVAATEAYKLAKAGDDVTLQCVVKGVPTPFLTWLKDSEEIGEDHERYKVLPEGVLILSKTEASDGGEYTCLAENQLGRKSDFIFLDVGTAPEMVQSNTEMSVGVGEDAALPCLAVGFPPPSKSWRRRDARDMRIMNVEPSGDGDLHLNNVGLEEGGVYVCTAENVFGEAETEVTVTITGIVAPVLDPLSRPHGETTVRVGQRVTLPCRVLVGVPPPTTAWYRDGERLDAVDGVQMGVDNALVIPRVEQHHAGSYECVVTNAGGSASQGTALLVIEPPSFVDDERLVYKVNEMSSLVVTCEADGVPKPLVTWEKDRMPLLPSPTIYKDPENNSLVVSEALVDDSGVYTCTAVNAAGKRSKSAVLVVQVPPSIGDVSELENAVEGSLVTLRCHVRAVPAARITWYRDDVPVASFRDAVETLDDGEAIRFVANMSDTGMYKCLATNDAGSDSKDILLVVLVSPNIYPPHDEHHTASVGGDFTLDCHVNGYPRPRVVWSRNGGRLAEVPGEEYEDDGSGEVDDGSGEVVDERVTATRDGKLMVKEVREEDVGFYVCDAENEAGISQKIFYVQVAVAPRIVDEGKLHIRLMEGEDYSLPCSAVGNPTPLVAWHKDGRPVVGFTAEDAVALEDGTLVIVNASDSSTGVYTCSADNAEGGDKRNYFVQVAVAPTMSDSGESKNLDVVEGDDVVVSCPSIDAVPAPNIQWLKNGRPIRRRDAPTDAGRLLTLHNASTEDAGNYTCVASNLAGRTEATYMLAVLTMPTFTTDDEREKMVVAETPFTLRCDAVGTPTPRISWKKNGVPVTSHTAPGVVMSPDRRSLAVVATRVHDAGVYQCAATNRVGRRDRDFKIRVTVPPEMEGFREEEVVAVKDSAVLLHCPVSGLPPPDIAWSRHGGEKLVGDSHHVIISEDRKLLELPRVRLKDDGVYACVGVNTAGVATKHFNVSVLEAATVEGGEVADDRRVSEGKIVALQCRVRGRPTPDVVWLHNGRLVVEDNDVASAGDVETRRLDDGVHQLTLTRARPSDAGKYTCLASNEVGVAEKTFRLKVMVPPRLSRGDATTTPDHVDAVSGSPATLRCPVDVRAQSVDIRWSKDGAELPSRGRILYIASARVDHAGNYTCVAQNNAGRVASTFTLDVLVPPSLSPGSEPSSHLMVTSNDPLRMGCNVTGHPEPSIQWFKGVKPLTTDEAALRYFNKTLVIERVEASHGGQYSCLASNTAGTTEMTFTVDVEEPPKMEAQARPLTVNHTVKLHRRLALQCPMTGSPPPTITWYKDGVMVRSGQNVHVSSDGRQLHVLQATVDSGGEFECVAENHAGRNKIHFAVLVVVPAEWSDWGEWSECSAVCGKGEQVRVRQCQTADRTGRDKHLCAGEADEWRSCQMPECQIDGGWSAWSSWTSCSESCGRATRRRYRKCDSPEPEFGGHPCLGSDGQQEYCLQAACPVNGQWSSWSEWSECSASCGRGTKHRLRRCNSPAPSHDGEECRGRELEAAECDINHCVQHGGWSTWAAWSACSSTCGPGMQRRHRTCSEPAPKFGGSPCFGDNLQLEKCQSHHCDRVPLHASLHISGRLNGETLPASSQIAARISDVGGKRVVSANVDDMLAPAGGGGGARGWFPYVGFMLAPVSWSAAAEEDRADNGYSLTSGRFKQQSQIEFATGEELTLHHTARGLGDDGALHVEIEVQGDVPLMQPEASVVIEPFQEDFVQTGPNSLFASSKSFLVVDGKRMPYSWNNSVSYGTQATMPYLVERLSTTDIAADYDAVRRELRYAMSSAIRRGVRDKCPEGFTHDARHMHCTDVDECEYRRRHRCHATQRCENTLGAYTCSCKPGFRAPAAGKRCQDVNECLQGLAVCSHQCQNTRGSFKCLCPRGYELQADASTCAAIIGSLREAPSRNSVQYVAESPFYASKCPPGYHDVAGQCQDTDECTAGRGACGAGETCLNTRGSYQCLDTACPRDYLRHSHTGSCVKFCEDASSTCADGATESETLTHSVVTLDADAAEPHVALVRLRVTEHGGRRVAKTRFRVLENEKGKPFRVRLEGGEGVVYALKHLVPERVYKIVVLALSYDDSGKLVLNTTRFVIYIHLAGD